MNLSNLAPEIDALRQGMDWDTEDIARAQILVETTFGDSHPGSAHLDRLAKMAGDGIKYGGAKPSHFTVTDICDGIAQGHAGMNYSLVSREMIVNMVEIHQMANGFDGMVCVSSCDISVPAHLMAMARLDVPAIFVPGGVMPMAAEGFTLEQIGNANANLKKQKITSCQMKRLQQDACTGCGACQFMGTAATMQVMAEALGLALPHSALMPASMKFIDNMSKSAGKQILNLVKQNCKVSDILTKDAMHNAIVIHGAIGGSTNALLHLPAIAHEAGIDFDPDYIDKVHRSVPFLVNTRPVGSYATDMFWYAGGVPQVMLMLKDHLKLDVMTVTGKTLGENLEDIAEELAFYQGYLQNYKLEVSDIICELSSQGAIAVLKGNIAEQGCVVKYTGLPASMRLFRGNARVFDDEISARNAILQGDICEGDCIVIRYAGPKGCGMPEMFYTTEALCADPKLIATTAIITDGRFSGASKGPCIGHISPEAAEGGAIAFIEDGDIIEINIEQRSINLCGVDLAARRAQGASPAVYEKGVLGYYRKHATSAMDGGYIDG